MNSLLFEWKLIMRNKRLKQQFLVYVLYFPVMIYMLFKISPSIKETFMLREFFLCATFSLTASCMATLAFSINASFIEKQLIMPYGIFNILLAKYKLFCIIALFLFVLFFPITFLWVSLDEIISALFFNIGFVYFCFFYSALYSYKSFDIKETSFNNWQGMSFTIYALPVAILLIATGFIALLYRLFGENITLIVMSAVGLAFMATHRIWLKFIAKKFEDTKYERLERFREE